MLKTYEKSGSVTDFKNKNKANYKDTRIILTEAVLVPFFCRYFEHLLVVVDNRAI